VLPAPALCAGSRLDVCRVLSPLRAGCCGMHVVCVTLVVPCCPLAGSGVFIGRLPRPLGGSMGCLGVGPFLPAPAGTRGTFVCFVCFVAACPLPPRCHSTPTLWLHQLFAPGVRCNTVRLCVWIPVVLMNQSPALIYGLAGLPVVGRCCALGLYVVIGPVLPATEGELCQLLALASALLFLYLLSPCRRGLVGSGEGALRCHLPLFALLTRAGICSPPADCARVCCWYWHWRRGRAAPSGLAPALLRGACAAIGDWCGSPPPACVLGQGVAR